MEMNKGEAEKCRDIGKKHLRSGNNALALKFFEKSLRMFPLPGVEGMRDRAKTHLEENLASETRRKNAKQTQSSHTSSNHRGYSREQEQIVTKINSCKTHYEVLSVPHTADENEIKRAYRKLALKLHPDKNSAPGAEDAFKAVGKAFSTLSDPQKRAYYDKNGNDDQSTESNPSGFRGGFQDEVSPEDIFNMFFGGGTHRGMYRQRQQDFAREQRHRTPFAQLAHLFPLLVIFVLSFMTLPGEDTLPFSLYQTVDYPIERTTQSRMAVRDITYFVGRDFDRRYMRTWRDLVNVEKLVQKHYVNKLRNTCDRERDIQRRAIQRARKVYEKDERERAMKEAMNVALPSCRELDSIRAY